jgi:uncharacterized protein (TIGR03083 family)
MTKELEALQTSVSALARTVEGLQPAQLLASAYPTKWTVADALSHLGSGAVIFRRRFEDGVAGRQVPSDFAQGVWAEWDAKPADLKAADFMAADRALVERLASSTDEERARFVFEMGPLTSDFAGFVKMRLNEHAVHSWDVEVAFDPEAALAVGPTEVVIDNLQMIVGFVGKPVGSPRRVVVLTNGPQRVLTLAIGADAVSLGPGGGAGTPDLEIPAEAFIRLVYGRLDPDHTPPTKGLADLDQLRQVFPGF